MGDTTTHERLVAQGEIQQKRRMGVAMTTNETETEDRRLTVEPLDDVCEALIALGYSFDTSHARGRGEDGNDD